MSKVLGRMKDIFKRGPKPRQLPPGAFPNPQGNPAAPGTITKPQYPTDDDDEDDDDAQNGGNYNVTEQARLRGQQKNTVPSYESSQHESLYGPSTPRQSTPAPTTYRGTSSGFAPGLPMNNNPNNTMTSPQNRNTNPPPNPQPQSGLPFLNQIQNPASRTPLNPAPPPINNPPPPQTLPNNPSPAPPTTNNPPAQTANPTVSPQSRGFFSDNNNVQPASPRSATTMPQSSPAGFPSTFHTDRPSMNDSNNYTPTQQQNSWPSRASSFRGSRHDDDNSSRLELDYPIENVLIDANIPAAIAVKINDAVERDRRGNTHHVHRYTYEPKSQQITYDHHHDHHRHHQSAHQQTGHSNHRGGTRHIREIHHKDQNPVYNDLPHQRAPHHRHRNRSYSDMPLEEYVDQLIHAPGSRVIHAQDSADLQRILNQHVASSHLIPAQPSQLSPYPTKDIAFPEPIAYYTAQALPNDPMRNY